MLSFTEKNLFLKSFSVSPKYRKFIIDLSNNPQMKIKFQKEKETKKETVPGQPSKFLAATSPRSFVLLLGVDEIITQCFKKS